MYTLYKYVSTIIMLGFLVGCGTILGTTEGSVDIETPLATEIQKLQRPETLSDLQMIFQSNNDICQLPCFFGFRLQSSTEEEVIEFLQPQAIGPNEPELSYSFPEDSGQSSLFWIGFSVQDNLVTHISVTVDNPSEWLPADTLELPYTLSIMTSEPQAYLSISFGQRRIFLTLAYDEGVLAQYAFELQVEGGIVSSDIDKPFLFCPRLDRNELIIIRLAEANAQTLLEDHGTLAETVSDRIWPVERMTSMAVDEFIQQIIENPDQCIELPSYPELTEMGYNF